MALAEFLRGSGSDPQERLAHSSFDIEVFPDGDETWALIKQLDNASGQLSEADEKKFHALYPEMNHLGQLLTQVATDLLVNPQIRVKNTLHVSGNEPTHLSLVGMLAQWQDRLRLGMIENLEKLMQESYSARALMQKILSATASHRGNTVAETISLISVNESFKTRLPDSITNNVPSNLSRYDVINTVMNTGKGLRLATISHDLGYPIDPYEELMKQANEEYQKVYASQQ